jgi:hyperosmotically inducible periplasmic protein
MKRHNIIKWTIGVLLTLGVVTAYAQSSDTTAYAPASASPAQGAAAQRKANRLLSKQVRRVLVKVKGLDSSAIVVIAKGGAITLGGSVPEASQTALAVSAAQGVPGVDSVREKLIIKAPGQ